MRQVGVGLMSNGALVNLPSIYDAAINSSTWGESLESTAHSIGAKGALLLLIEKDHENVFRVGHFSNIWRRAPERAKIYNERFSQYEKPVWEALESMPRQQLILDTEFWKDEPNLRNRPDYRFLSEQVGICHKCAARLNNNESWFDSLVIHFDESHKSIPHESIRFINALLPHVAKSVELGRAFDILRSNYQAVLTALDYIDIGICIALPNGTIIVANEEASRIFENKDGVKLGADRKLVCRDKELEARFSQAIARTSSTAIGEAATPEVLFSVNRPSGLHDFLIEVAPLRDHTAELETNLQGALITLVDPENSSHIDVDRIAQAYRLTKTEALVCGYSVKGWSTRQIADERCVSTETIKSQMKSILSKTDCQHRSQLIRLALKASPPIRRATKNEK